MKYIAYMRYETLKDKKIDPETSFAIIGKDSEEIRLNAEQYGTGPYFVSSMFELSKDWNV